MVECVGMGIMHAQPFIDKIGYVFVYHSFQDIFQVFFFANTSYSHAKIPPHS